MSLNSMVPLLVSATVREKLITTWGVGWVVWLLGHAIVRLTPIAAEPWLDGSLTAAQKTLFIGWLGFNGYAEGYKAFQKKFAPRVISRAVHLGQHPTPFRLLLALPFCMSLFYAQRRQRIVSWTFIVVLIAVIVAVRALPQPWRGIIDGGVVLGLGWGVCVLVWLMAKYLITGESPPSVDLPDDALAST